MTMERKQKEISPTKIQLIQELEFYDALIKQHKQEEMYKEGLTNMNEAANSKQDKTMFEMKTADNKEKLKMTTSSEFQKKKSETSNPYKFIKHSPKRNLVKSASNSKNQSLKRYESKKSEVVPKNTKLEETNNKIKNMKEIIAQIELCQKQIKLQEITKISSEKCDTELHSSNEMTLRKDICSLSSHSPQEKGISNPSLKRKVHAVGNSILQKTGQKLLKQAVNTVTNRNVQDEKRISRYKLIKVKKEESRSQNVSTNKYKYLDSKFSKAKLQIATGKTKMAAKRSATMVDGETYPGTSIGKMRKKSDNSYGPFYSSKFKLLRHAQSRHTEGCGKSYFLEQFQHKHSFATSHISLKRSSSTVHQYKNRLKSRSNRKDSSRKLINKHCWYYKRFGKCSKGSKCPFQHGAEQVATKRSSPVDNKVIVKHKKSTHETDVGHSTRKRRSSSITLQKYKKLGKESQGHKKSAKYCLYYNRFGKCNRGAKCNFLHDPSKIAVCTRFLRGTCLVYNCPFSHKVSKEKMPVCKFFLKGQCHKEDCYYSHVKVGENAEICEEFVRGYCPAGDQCKKKHVLQCPEYDKLGSCSKGTACKLKHVSVKSVEGGNRLKLDIQPQLPPKSCESKIDDKDDINLPFKDRILPAFISINTTSSSRAIKSLKKSLEDKPGESSEDSNVLTRTSILPSFISLSESGSKESNL